VSGNISQTVKTHKVSVLPRVPLSHSVKLAKGVTIHIQQVQAINAVSHVPGDVDGPAVQVTLVIKNLSSKPLNLNYAEAQLTDSKGDPGVLVTTAASHQFSGKVKPGAHATGIYVFRVPTNRRDPVTVTASYTGAGPVARFVGAVE
jgi:hypothetical protein